MPKTLNIHNVGVLDDSTVFGVGIADTFEAQFKTYGGTVTRSSYKKEQTSDWRSILLKFKAAGATGVYVGGTDDQNICIPRAQMKQIGWDVPYMGGDGIETTDCVDQAAGNELNINATSAGADATQIPGAKATIDAFRKAFPGPNDFGGYTMQAYDAANALMAAIGRAVNDANGSTPTRDQVRAEMAKTKGFVGVIGTYDFDANGDNSLKIVSIYTVDAVADPATSTGVCGKTASKDCFVWKAQFGFFLIAAVALLLLAIQAVEHPSQFAQVLVFGLADGAIYALVALGYTMVYGIIELINFAHGDVFTLGAYVGATLMGFFASTNEDSFLVANLVALLITFPVVMLIMGAVNVTIERVAYRPLRNAPRLAPLITAIGMSFLLEGFMFLWHGPATVHVPDLLPHGAGFQTTIGGVFISFKDIFVVVAAAILVTLLAVFINRSKLGKAMRATAQDRDASQLMGINI